MSKDERFVGSLSGQAFFSASFTMEACSLRTEKFAALLKNKSSIIVMRLDRAYCVHKYLKRSIIVADRVSTSINVCPAYIYHHLIHF